MKTVRFEDLSEEVKAKIIAAQADENQSEVDFEFNFEALIKKGKEIGFDIELENISYSGFYSQGDGLSFTCFVDTKKFIEEANHGLIREEQLALLEKYEDEEVGTIEIIRNYNNYVHEKSCMVETTNNRELFALYGAIERARYQLSVETYTDMKDHYDEVGSNDYVSNQLSDLGYWYSSDGKQLFQIKPRTYDYDFNELVAECEKQKVSIEDRDSLLRRMITVTKYQNILDRLPDTYENAILFMDGVAALHVQQEGLDTILPNYFINDRNIENCITGHSYSEELEKTKNEVYMESYIYSTSFYKKDKNDILKYISDYINSNCLNISVCVQYTSDCTFIISFGVSYIDAFVSVLDLKNYLSKQFFDAKEMYQSNIGLSDDELQTLRKWLETDDKEHGEYEPDIYFEDNSYGLEEIVNEVLDRFDTCPDDTNKELFNKIQNMIFEEVK